MSRPVPYQPPTETAEAVTLVNRFTLPAEEAETFLDRWQDSARIMRAQPGFVSSRLYRQFFPDPGQVCFLNVAEWASGLALDAARVDPDWLATVRRMLNDPALHVVPDPVVYQLDREITPK
jgi:hypothetical protein